MRFIDVSQKYESRIYVIDKEKLIVKLDCTCRDFQFRCIKKVGENADIKRYTIPCKHLTHFVARLIKQGYKLKIPEEMIGSDKLTPALRKELLERANNMCEDNNCNKIEKLQIHRKVRGSKGGKYNKKNCVVLCANGHRLRHANEDPRVKSK